MVCVPKQIVSWYYMKLLDLLRGNELYEINFEFKWKQPEIKESSTNNFRHD